MDFIYDSSTELLREIRVSYGGKLVKKATLITRKSLDPERYFLDEVRMSGSNGVRTGCYKFDYHLGYKYDKAHAAVDYWGYNRGGVVYDRVPVQYADFIENPNNPSIRVPIGGETGRGNFSNSLEFCLRKVTYPSGGSTEYLYDANEVHTPGSTYESPAAMTAGGVRLKSIIDSPVVGKDVVRTFEYGSMGKLNGIGYSAFPACPETFAQNVTKHYLIPTGILGRYTDYSGRCRISSNQNFVTSDCDIYYTNVCEIIDGTRTMHYFPTSFSTNCGVEVPYPAPIGYEAVLAQEDSCVYYRNAIPIETRRRRQFISNSFVKQVKPFAIFDKILDASSINDGLKQVFLTSYSILATDVYHKNSQLRETQTKITDKITTFTTSQKWDYGTALGKKLLNIKNDNEKVEFVYPSDMPSRAAHALMIQRNETATPIETRHYVDEALRKRIRYDYVVDTCTNRGYSLAAVTESTDDKGNEFRVVESYGDYLPCGKPGEVTLQDGRVVCLVWANEGDWLIAAIEGMTAGQVYSVGIDLKAISGMVVVAYEIYDALDALRISHPEAHVTTYHYQPTGELITKRTPDGVAEYYTYDDSGRLSEIKDNQLKTISKYEYHEANQ